MLSAIANATASKERPIAFLQENNLLLSSATCVCGKAMHWNKRTDLKDGYTWRCSAVGCRKKLSIRHKSFFSKTKLPLEETVQLLYCWAAEIPCRAVPEHVDAAAPKGVENHYNSIRDVSTTILSKSPTLTMGGETGGEGIVVNEFIVEYGMKVRVASEQRS